MTEVIIKKYAMFLAVIVLAFIAGIYFTGPKLPEYFEKTKNIKVKKETINDLNKSIELIRKKEIEKVNALAGDEKQIYEPEIKSSDAMVNFNGMLDTILQLSKQAGLKTKTIEFKAIPESDVIKQNHSGTHDATLLTAQVIGTYTELQNFLREVYRHQYLIGVNEIKVSPYQHDKTILIIDLSLSLYAKK